MGKRRGEQFRMRVGDVREKLEGVERVIRELANWGDLSTLQREEVESLIGELEKLLE